MRKDDVTPERTVRVSLQEAQAVERCLRAEATVRQDTLERVRIIHFARRSPSALGAGTAPAHALQVTVVERSGAPDVVTVQVVRVLSDEVRTSSLALPRRALRAALRPHTRAELLPQVPQDAAPILGVECSRRTFRSTDGWTLSVDRDLALHRMQPHLLERTGRLALGIPDRCVDGAAVLGFAGGGGAVPAWLSRILGAAAPWDVVGDGLALIAPRPAARGVARELRLIPSPRMGEG